EGVAHGLEPLAHVGGVVVVGEADAGVGDEEDALVRGADEAADGGERVVEVALPGVTGVAQQEEAATRGVGRIGGHGGGGGEEERKATQSRASGLLRFSA